MGFNLEGLIWDEDKFSHNPTRIVNSPGRTPINKGSVDMLIWYKTPQGVDYWDYLFSHPKEIKDEDKQYILGACRNSKRMEIIHMEPVNLGVR